MENKLVYGEFNIERTFNAQISKVYKAFSDKNAKEGWFKGPSEENSSEHEMDFRVGGTEMNRGKFHDGVTHTFKAAYYDIVPEERIIYSYEMYLDDKRISVSLAIIEFVADGENTKLSLREFGVFLDGFDKPAIREEGTRGLMEALEKSLI